jgi:endoglucanase
VLTNGARGCRLPSKEQLIGEDATYRLFRRRRHVDTLGCFLFAAFVAVAAGYAFFRVQFSLAPLRGILWYGILVFAVEMLGALSIVFYGIWLVAKPDNTDIEAAGAGAPLRRRYHVRVLVPCYTEPLAIVQRTVLAARRAAIPPGCEVTIYLCDDGKRPEKRRFIESLAATPGPRAVYITGRARGAGKTLNGKSENLNHCLKLIYPADRGADEVPNIPLTEVMCLFDADQSCSQQFFTALLPYIDSGDNVAVALSPQLMFNVAPNVDIFNHQNVHFWEKMQPGMDALGFISLTGTNMILRCRALQDCGWFPTESVTEDWELGMRMARARRAMFCWLHAPLMAAAKVHGSCCCKSACTVTCQASHDVRSHALQKKWGWECRYVQQYNAIGEAPDEVRQAFQQRSRWCKGHFQTFWSAQCPLVDLRLGPFYQLCYSSTCLSYLSAGAPLPHLVSALALTAHSCCCERRECSTPCLWHQRSSVCTSTTQFNIIMPRACSRFQHYSSETSTVQRSRCR